MTSRFRALLLSTMILLSACGDRHQGGGTASDDGSGYTVLTEAWLSTDAPGEDVDSPVLWQGPNGERWIISACRSTDRLLVHEAETGLLIRTVGVNGSGPGQFNRPNSIAVIDDLAIVVERDNHRLQVFRLPAWTVLGSFGDSALIKPYGIAVRRDSSAYVLYVTDNYEMPDGSIPPDEYLGARVKMYRMTADEHRVSGEFLKTFGDVEGDGVLRAVESICIDTTYHRLLIADENGEENDVKIYDLDGVFTESVMGSGVFRYQIEGIALYASSDSSGYYVCADQDMTDNTFHLFDRATLEHAGAFRGAATANSDGIMAAASPSAASPSAASPSAGFPSTRFAEGFLVAVRDDCGLSAFDWTAIADTLKLQHRIPPTPIATIPAP